MVTEITNPEDERLEPVTKLALIDVSGVRDPNMQALILLARSLGWNVMQKVNQPVVITAPSGFQRRIPTNTSIRMSVFQTHLSAITLHSSLEASLELIEEIIKSVKPSREHQARLRLAVGQTVQEHRRALEQAEAAEQRRNEEHLTQTPEIVWETPPELPNEQTVVPTEGEAADGGVHGEIVDQHPFLASVNTTKHTNRVYESVTSFERIWTDGYIDFACMFCGKAYSTPKGVGSHYQIHTKTGEAPSDNQGTRIKETSRPATDEEQTWIKERNRRLGWGRQESRATAVRKAVAEMEEAEPKAQSPGIAPEDAPAPMSDADRIELILAILLPDATKQIESLLDENDDLTEALQAVKAERDKLKQDLQALRDIIAGIE